MIIKIYDVWNVCPKELDPDKIRQNPEKSNKSEKKSYKNPKGGDIRLHRS